MDQILEKHLKKIFDQQKIVAENNVEKKVEVSTNNIPNIKRIKTSKFNSDPILSKHLVDLFKNNNEISNEIKAGAEKKKLNDNLLSTINGLFKQKVSEPLPDTPVKLLNDPIPHEIESQEEIPEVQKSEVLDKNLDIEVPPKDDSVKPSVIDAYKAAIKPLPPSEEFVNQEKEKELEKVAEVPQTPENVYVQVIKDTDKEVRETPVESNDDEFFKFLERNKDNPKLKNFFNYHSESLKKEILKLSENFTKQKMLIASESGGGSGNVTYQQNIVQSNKKTFLIGDNVSKEYNINHNLNTKELYIAVYEAATDNLIYCSIENIDLNNTKFYFSIPIALNSIKVVIIA